MRYENVIWSANINPIGGVESVLFYLVKKYKDKPITILYREGADAQLIRLSQYANLVKFKKQVIECDRFFSNYGYEEVKGYIKCDKGYNIIHANYKYLKDTDPYIEVIDNDFETLAVSDYAGSKYLEIGGKSYQLCPNPIELGEVKSPFLIVSATRLAQDKGRIVERIETLANRLTERNIPFLWVIYTNSKKTIANPNVKTLPGRLDILPMIKKADFVAQLSDEEACCMTALESLSLGTPMLVTKIPSFYEQGMNESNAIFFDFDMSNVDECIDRMCETKFNFKFTPKADIWGDLLVGKRKEKIIPMKMIKVRANKKWLEGGGIPCSDLGRVPEVGEEWVVSEERAKDLVAKGRTEIVCELESKVEPKEEPKVEIKPEVKKEEKKLKPVVKKKKA